MEEKLKEVLSELKNNCGDNLLSLILYGSAAGGNHVAEKSDVNLLIVLKDVTLEHLSKCERVILGWQKKIRLNPVFWSEEELKGSTEIFPIEFTDLLRARCVIHGTDPFEGLTVDTMNLRHQIEFELRVKLLRLRSEWIRMKKGSREMEDFLMRAGTSFLNLFVHARNAWRDKFPAHLEEPFVICKKLKRREVKMSPKELENLYIRVHESVKEVVRIVDAIQ